MNEDKLTEAAKNYAVNTVGEYDEDFPELNLNELDSECQSAFKAGARWHESLPLADRLSESEKDELRGIYNAGDESLKHYQRMNREAKDAMQANMAVVIYNQHKERLRLLESIFGKNLFTPTEQ